MSGSLKTAVLRYAIIAAQRKHTVSRIYMNNQTIKTPAIVDDKGKTQVETDSHKQSKVADKSKVRREINGPKGLEPTRYGDWESKGRCYDF